MSDLQRNAKYAAKYSLSASFAGIDLVNLC
jgi:hypothetical protein